MPGFEVRDFTVHCCITPDQAARDFELLCNFDRFLRPVGDDVWPEAGPLILHPLGVFRQGCHHGKRFTSFFQWRHRLAVETTHNRSAVKVLESWRAGGVTIPNAMERLGCSPYDALKYSSALQSCVHFRAGVALVLAEMFGAECCLDPCAGWGDRLTGWCAAPTVRSIDLIEPRRAAALDYKRQFLAAQALGSAVERLEVHIAAAEDRLPTLDGSWDLILTSPPYFNLEIYDRDGENEALQVSSRYSSPEAYLNGFLVPLAHACLARLSPMGVFCLNITDNERSGLVITRAFLAQMHVPGFVFIGTFAYELPTNPALRSAIFLRKSEPIYVFCRQAAEEHVRGCIQRALA